MEVANTPVYCNAKTISAVQSFSTEEVSLPLAFKYKNLIEKYFHYKENTF
jgi:hypothetical protein